MEYTRAYCHEHALDIYFLPTAEKAREYAEKLKRTTGRATITFTEPVKCGKLHFELHCAAVERRPKPTITVIT